MTAAVKSGPRSRPSAGATPWGATAVAHMSGGEYLCRGCGRARVRRNEEEAEDTCTGKEVPWRRARQRGVVNSPSLNGRPPAHHAELCPELIKPGSPPAGQATAQRDNTDVIVRDDDRGFVSSRCKAAAPTEPNDGALPALVDIQAVARSLGISMRQVRRFVADGEIPFIRVGHLIRFDPGELKEWIDCRRAGFRQANQLMSGSQGDRRSAKRTLDGCAVLTMTSQWQRSAGHGRPDRRLDWSHPAEPLRVDAGGKARRPEKNRGPMRNRSRRQAWVLGGRCTIKGRRTKECRTLHQNAWRVPVSAGRWWLTQGGFRMTLLAFARTDNHILWLPTKGLLSPWRSPPGGYSPHSVTAVHKITFATRTCMALTGNAPDNKPFGRWMNEAFLNREDLVDRPLTSFFASMRSLDAGVMPPERRPRI